MALSKLKMVMIALAFILICLGEKYFVGLLTGKNTVMRETGLTPVSQTEKITAKGKGNTTCQHFRCPQPYKKGKEILTFQLPSCPSPTFVNNSTNPCWKNPQKRQGFTCVGRIILLGVDKSGTSDMSLWFGKHPQTRVVPDALFKDHTEDFNITKLCPMEWYERMKRYQFRSVKEHSKVIVIKSPTSAVESTVYGEARDSISRTSVPQYLQYTETEQTRYIITMREPASRLISHFFYLHQLQQEIPGFFTGEADFEYFKYPLEQLGDSFFHKIVLKTINELRICLEDYGTTSCILEWQLSPITYSYSYLLLMIRHSCYSINMAEVLKILPRDKIYFSKMEEYSQDRKEAIKKIYEFVGLSTDDKSFHKTTNEVRIINKGKNSKPVLPETVELLKEFFKPFNVHLANLLDDDKWLWM